jgi:NAD(P)-dependent dehydrogenase (short-subunit alcohol dehydrogenase family)
MKVAAVSGGRGHIGAAIVRRLARMGLHVAVLDVSATPVSGTEDERVSHWRLDIRDPAAVRDFVAGVGRTFGPITVLVNSAGLSPPHARVAEMRVEELEATLAVNLIGAVNLSQAVLPAMTDAAWGRIVNITSVQARGGWRHRSAYATSKAALRTFTESMAMEVAARGVLVNAVAPGHIKTPMTEAAGVSIDWTSLIARVPLGRLVTADEVAEAVAFLCGKGASGIAGQTITVDGGYTTNLIG